MKIINNKKLEVTVCGQNIPVGGSITVVDEVWKKEYTNNLSIQHAINTREITAIKEESKKK